MMGGKRKLRRTREAELSFEAISIEGGLLSPEWLSKIAQLGAGMQTEADYRVPKGLNLRDEIGRYWRIAQAYWSEAQTARKRGANGGEIARRFVTALLREVLGFSSLAAAKPVVIDNRIYPIGLAALGGRVPIVVAAFDAESGVDTPSTAFGDGGRRRSAFGLAQEFLNAQDGALWGIACDGRQLRIVRDNASLTRPAWIAADLERIFSEERFADFAALWLLAHETRFGRETEPVAACSLEVWRSAGLEEGTRAREHLRRGVEEALLTLGQGFLAHAENHVLRSALEAGTLSTKAYQNELLRLVYRIIFLLTVEERGVLHASSASDACRQLYEGAYSFRHLRDRSLRRSAHDRFSDLWEAAKIVFRGLAVGEPRLGLPALAGIFARSQCVHLDASKLENRSLLLAVFKLAWLKDAGGLVRVNWRDMGPEELGSVYESLLELTPQITHDGRQFAFATGNEAKGNARKTTGSYYTPDGLVQVLLDGALEPVIAETVAAKPASAVEALLELSIVDPACGSGHFLLAAARRLAAHVARLTANGTPSMSEYRHALRQVVGRCIYGVDLNPMAVELCKVGLWMEAVEPGLPLGFLDSHIQHGNALLGTTPELVERDIPDAAWEPIEGDDTKVASALKKRNKDERRGQGSFDFAGSRPAHHEAELVARAVESLDDASDATLDALATKEARWRSILGSGEYRHQKFVADAWCSAFVWPKQPGELGNAARTTDLLARIRDDGVEPPELTSETVRALSRQYAFFHWHLQFPQVFAKGGFDVVLGNPPWEMPETDERHFFRTIEPAIASEPSPRKRSELIAELCARDARTGRLWQDHVREHAGARHFMANSGRLPASSEGRLNYCRSFIEHSWSIAAPAGRVGLVIQSGLWSAQYDRPLWLKLVAAQSVVSIYDFENRERLFQSVDSRARFALLVLSRQPQPRIGLAFWLRNPDELKSSGRLRALSIATLQKIEPETLAIPQFHNAKDLELLSEALNRCNRFGEATEFTHTLRLMFSSSDDAFKVVPYEAIDDPREKGAESEWLPVYEGKMIGILDHRKADIIVNKANASRPAQEKDIPSREKESASRLARPQSWIATRSVRARRFGESTGQRDWELVFCDVTAATNERTVIAAIVPLSGLTRSLPAIYLDSPTAATAAKLLAVFSSFAFDYFARLRVSSNHLTQGILAGLPIPKVLEIASIDRSFLVDRVLELTYTASDLSEFARDIGYQGPPFGWNSERRFVLRSELDAACFHLYGLSRDDTEYVMETFPIVRKTDEKNHGEYRTKRVILDIYDAMAAAMQVGTTYQTRLHPPAADARVAHPARVVEPAPAGSKARQRKSATRPQAPPDVAAMRDDEWARPHSFERGEVQAAIVAVMKQFGEPVPPQRVRLAALYCLEPQLLVPSIDGAERSNWIRVVGADAERAVNSPLDQTSVEWGKAISSLRGRGALFEASQPETWALGTSESGIDTSGWADGRAAFVVSVLARQPIAGTDTPSTERLPALVREWLAHAA